jgi:hypothetical protein
LNTEVSLLSEFLEKENINNPNGRAEHVDEEIEILLDTNKIEKVWSEKAKHMRRYFQTVDQTELTFLTPTKQ